MKDDNLMFAEQFLLPFHINIEIRVIFIEVMEGDTFEPIQTGDKLPVNP